mmetsp:Transcript_15016/g.19863  ORF Transcript_15016/g.19863 Transcript_15016/m.19863 type:complete len:204 (-) Transcript_15016:117-728(-)|eukprot:CAMPEP_0197319532 /NCGR_PEP_ID=MMETSP0891-20130614/55230_1 /TAXON_ID=44058 ORGANISM="Aureoumbra lagunensis, Strain CCMP1510" /NCGR_SAMPLE_ID=MMETSP0891 /ASSEMBLY_ACC=CAM_ASM_000534 /LENGTH=203 /DNA_ID=CAMNT_0042810507 /DNA_START=25 /DNA_END=636 /DNA_ORIENTATION=+
MTFSLIEGCCSKNEQKEIVKSILTSVVEIPKDVDGQRLELDNNLSEMAVASARRAYRIAANQSQDKFELSRIANNELTCQGVVYGPKGKMASHLDSSVNKKPKFVVILSFANPCIFNVNKTQVELSPGSALVFDAANILHGVERILSSSLSLGGGRISLIFFEKLQLPYSSEQDSTFDSRIGEFLVPKFLFAEEEERDYDESD